MLSPFASLPTTFREALAIHDIIMTFGVSAENVFVSVISGRLVVTAKEGDKMYSVNAGSFDGDGFKEKWTAACRTYNASPKQERADLLDQSRARDCAVEIIAGLVADGFMPTSLRAQQS